MMMFGTTGVLVGTFFLNSLFLQNVLRASPLETGLAFLPLVLVIGGAAHVGPRLLVRWGARSVVVGGLALVTGGDLLLTGASSDAAYVSDLLPGLLLVGLGVGLVFVSISVTAMSEIPGERAGLASGLMTTGHEIGGAFGISIFSAIALASGAGGAAFANGYGESALAGAILAGVLALVAVVAIPAVRPTSVAQVAMH